MLFSSSLRCKLDYLRVRGMRARLKTFSEIDISCKSFYGRYAKKYRLKYRRCFLAQVCSANLIILRVRVTRTAKNFFSDVSEPSALFYKEIH